MGTSRRGQPGGGLLAQGCPLWRAPWLVGEIARGHGGNRVGEAVGTEGAWREQNERQWEQRERQWE